MYRYTKLSLLAMAIAISAAAYAAKTSQQNDALALAQARVSLSQAVAIAEQHAQGRAVRAELEKTPLASAYLVEVIRGDKTLDIKVAPDSGAVTAVAEDTPDHDDGQDRRD